MSITTTETDKADAIRAELVGKILCYEQTHGITLRRVRENLRIGVYWYLESNETLEKIIAAMKGIGL